jgi:hypothetical protein
MQGLRPNGSRLDEHSKERSRKRWCPRKRGDQRKTGNVVGEKKEETRERTPVYPKPTKQ